MIVLAIGLSASFITWKMVKDFYVRRFHKLIAHLIAVVTASFMFLSTMFLFLPKNYQRGQGPEVELSISSVLIVFVMIGVLYAFFRFAGSSSEK